MAYSNQTTHYGLPLPTGSDKSTFLDANQAFTDVDTALYAAETGISGVESDVQDLNTEITNLSTTVTGHTADIGALQNGLTSTNLLLQNTVEDVSQAQEDITELNTNLSELQQVLTGTLVRGVNMIYPTGSFNVNNCYIAKVDYLASGQWRDASQRGVQPWIVVDTAGGTIGIDIYGTSAMDENIVGLPFRCILRKL